MKLFSKNSAILKFIVCIVFSLSFSALSQNSNFEKDLDNYLQPLLEMNAWSGVIGVYKGGNPIFEKGYGFANREWEIENTITGKFRIASISKVFTEVAILKLVEESKLSLTDELSKFISDYPRGNEITIENLINHTSGIPHLNSFSNYDELIKFNYSIDEIISLFKDKELDFKPGTKYNYSNSGYVLLAYIIEIVAQKSYEKYIAEAILNPLKMNDTGIDNTSIIVPNRVNGYMFSPNAELINADYVNMDIKIGGGSFYSSLKDLNIFTNALVNRKILNKESLKKLPNIQGENQEKIFSANGRVQGFCHQIIYKYEEEINVIVLGNHYSNIAMPIADAIYNIYKSTDVIPHQNFLNQKTIISANDLKKYVGVYDFGFGPIGVVEIKSGKLVYGNPNKKQRDVLIPIGSDRFFYIQSWVILEFDDRDKDEFKTLNWVMGENKYPAT